MPTYMGIASQNTARASALLPAAGAWDATPTEIRTSYVKHMTLTFTYTRAGAGGGFDYQVESSIYSVAALVPAGVAEWTTQAIYAAGAVAAGADTTSLVQREDQSYTSQGAAAEDFDIGPIPLEGAYERIRVRARESGAVGTPGTLAIVMLLAGGG